MLAFLLFYFASAQLPTINVITTDGPIVGTDALYPPGGVVAYLGIPYATPPVGTLRWKPTLPNTPWTQPRSATYWGNQCLNATGPEPGNEFPPNITWSEDCLNLDIYVPNTTTVKRPVLLWIHGGSFNNDGNAAYKYHGFVMASTHDIIVVNINYRMGLFGFFAHPFLYAENSSFPSSGNYGFMDQIVAIDWVQKNIALFGGDPNRVTLGGQSAGASSVSYHMVSPRSQKGFQQACLFSDVSFYLQIPLTTAFEHTVEILAAMNEYDVFLGIQEQSQGKFCTNLSTPTGLLDDCLRQIPASVFKSFTPEFSFVSVDDYFFNESTFDSFNYGRYLKIPAVSLDDRDEGTIFLYTEAPPGGDMNMSKYQEFLIGELQFPANLTEIVEDFYGPCNGDCRGPASSIFGDAGIMCPTQVVAQMISAQSGNAWYFLWARTPSYSPAYLGASHTSDTPYWFGNIPYSVPDADTIEDQLSVYMAIYMASYVKGLGFNKTTNPSIPLDWPEYVFPALTALYVEPGGNISYVNSYGAEHCDLWTLIYPSLYSVHGSSFVYSFPQTFTIGLSDAYSFIPTFSLLCLSFLLALM